MPQCPPGEQRPVRALAFLNEGVHVDPGQSMQFNADTLEPRNVFLQRAVNSNPARSA